jgi:hypothetical protein
MKKTLIYLCAFLFSSSAFAFSAIAIIPGEAQRSFYVAFNYAKQSDADKEAIKGCQKQAKENNIGNISNKCTIFNKPKEPGYGAVSCGESACGWSYSYGNKQDAVDSAYRSCSKASKNCNSNDIFNWEDFSGFKAKKVKSNTVSGGNCRPNSTHLTCTSSCTNGNCIVTYPNGCKIRIQVQSKYNPFTNQWEFPAPPC